MLGSARERKGKVTLECRNGDDGVPRGRRTAIGPLDGSARPSRRKSPRVNLSRDAPRSHRLSRPPGALALALPPLVANKISTMPTRLRRTAGSWTIWFNRTTQRRVCPRSLFSEDRRIVRRPFSRSVRPRYVRRVRSLRPTLPLPTHFPPFLYRQP